MIENLIEKAKQYKIALGLSLLGAIAASFILLQGRDQGGTDVQQLTEQTSSSSSYMNEKSNKSNEISQSETEDQLVTVDVKGAVKKPGVYQLQSNSRVHDALEKAGGLTDEADLKSINQAQKLSDEAVVYVAKVGENAVDVTTSAPTSATSGTGQTKSALVNLNTATEADFQTISGIGQKRAQDIIAYREANGRFKSVDDLKNVSGIGAKTLEKLKEYVTVD
ncbi:helix-hairpin-helix domain-containing protein [Streptococcus gordonii]|uniref:Competence protein CelA n=1 Tax=Streptococcus gordonii (strain Challis / ATCC 35105 / BCRC 15272 / CH1 / DL1 / V288) TaxID=467705 RepID=A8AYM0_STRGC|nr:helix-hairpin-helix domain-containing protein [Streptococcus gordonii]ABV09227.1 competence protein CelA [Streptococcus gordonii str. Challis substr. CH1]MBZ2137988.1 helix-hairpin-helix domain-containing protein [Streptococcus gordonii]QGS45122.1 ComEA family DNA-binding protein [Streptococcus gordonii]VEE22368.1 competence protein CelA [Streptococcus gordonii]VTS83141.1 competence protein CelA [Streptococcus gordonii]